MILFFCLTLTNFQIRFVLLYVVVVALFFSPRKCSMAQGTLVFLCHIKRLLLLFSLWFVLCWLSFFNFFLFLRYTNGKRTRDRQKRSNVFWVIFSVSYQIQWPQQWSEKKEFDKSNYIKTVCAFQIFHSVAEFSMCSIITMFLCIYHSARSCTQ